MKLIDSHCHLDDDRYDSCRDAVVTRARDNGVAQIVLPSTTAERWQKVKRVASEYDEVYPAYGLHPMFMSQHKRQHLLQLESWIDHERPIAIGECGLDFFESRDDESWQLEFFQAQLSLAVKHQLPVIVHVRKAMDQVIALLRKSKLEYGGVIHSFAGSLQQARQLVELGFKLGIAATVDFERAKKLRNVVAEIDAAALLLESDAPDQPGINHRGDLNEPAFIVEHFHTIAQLRGISEQCLSEVLEDNTKALFGDRIGQYQGRILVEGR